MFHSDGPPPGFPSFAEREAQALAALGTPVLELMPGSNLRYHGRSWQGSISYGQSTIDHVDTRYVLDLADGSRMVSVRTWRPDHDDGPREHRVRTHLRSHVMGGYEAILAREATPAWELPHEHEPELTVLRLTLIAAELLAVGERPVTVVYPSAYGSFAEIGVTVAPRPERDQP